MLLLYQDETGLHLYLGSKLQYTWIQITPDNFKMKALYSLNQRVLIKEAVKHELYS